MYYHGTSRTFGMARTDALEGMARTAVGVSRTLSGASRHAQATRMSVVRTTGTLAEVSIITVKSCRQKVPARLGVSIIAPHK